MYCFCSHSSGFFSFSYDVNVDATLQCFEWCVWCCMSTRLQNRGRLDRGSNENKVGYAAPPGRVRVGKCHIWRHLIIWAGAMSLKTAKKKKVWRKDRRTKGCSTRLKNRTQSRSDASWCTDACPRFTMIPNGPHITSQHFDTTTNTITNTNTIFIRKRSLKNQWLERSRVTSRLIRYRWISSKRNKEIWLSETQD